MPTYLIIILCITAVLLSLAIIYGIVLFRKVFIVVKKLDYLIEDVTYKIEILSPIIDSLLKLSTYVDVMEEIIMKNMDTINSITKNNTPAIKKYVSQLQKALNEEE